MAKKRIKFKSRSKLPAIKPSSKIKPDDGDNIFWPDRLNHVRGIAARGLTDDEMAEVMGISPELMQSWKRYYPTFMLAIEEGRTVADAQVVEALHKNAVGFEYETDEVVRTRRGATVVTVKKKFLPDVQAQKFWLQNRAPKHWNRATPVSVSTPKGEAVRIRDETKAEIMNSILNLITPKPDSA